jgi:hypothetical protein
LAPGADVAELAEGGGLMPGDRLKSDRRPARSATALQAGCGPRADDGR